jgi:hypothetical protein
MKGQGTLPWIQCLLQALKPASSARLSRNRFGSSRLGCYSTLLPKLLKSKILYLAASKFNAKMDSKDIRKVSAWAWFFLSVVSFRCILIRAWRSSILIWIYPKVASSRKISFADLFVRYSSYFCHTPLQPYVHVSSKTNL